VPAVDSAVLKFRPVKHDENVNRTINLVKKAFSHRRKTLVNSLVLCGLDRNKILSAFKTMNIQERVRAQELSAGTYSELAALL
jgi:16S rRNA A1518/A1519 N6-dimethyltransferase RsmA/KsgA/DIM1 with predicted DNA glycosylase/AP lyase activity